MSIQSQRCGKNAGVTGGATAGFKTLWKGTSMKTMIHFFMSMHRRGGSMCSSRFLANALLLLGVVIGATGCMSLMPMLAPSVDAEKGISADFPFESRFVTVHGSSMHYVETGSGTPIVFIHGNPTSSYLWRNVLPIAAKSGRAIAVDLIGMGKSAKPDIAYHLEDHIRYFDGFMEAMNLKDVILVVHDWGGPIGIDYAMRHQDRVRGIVMMETLLRPMRWSEADFAMKYLFKKFRDPGEAAQIVGKENYFVEKLVPMMAGRKLSDAEMNAYRAPYLRESDRLPVVTWPQEVPIDGDPKRNEERLAHNFDLLKKSTVPLLLLRGRPGAIMKDELVADLQRALPRMTIKDIGPGIHFLQETQPTNIGKAISDWVGRQK